MDSPLKGSRKEYLASVDPSTGTLRQSSETVVEGPEIADLLAWLCPFQGDVLSSLRVESGSAVWPLISGLTDEESVVVEGLGALADAGLQRVVPLVLDLDPSARRLLATYTDEAGYQRLFHRGDPDVRAFSRLARAQGLDTSLPRPSPKTVDSRQEFRRALETELLELAEMWLQLAKRESAGQEILRAARWVGESTHDLRSLALEGELRIVPQLNETARAIARELAQGVVSTTRSALEEEYFG